MVFKNSSQRNIFAFTLAEVLIIIGIIGIVANLTIPTLLQGLQYKTYSTMLKKAYSTLESAIRSAVSDGGLDGTWANSGTFAQSVKPYLNILTDCGYNTGMNCFAKDVMYKELDNSDDFQFDNNPWDYKFRLADGTAYAIHVNNATCTGVSGTTLALQNVCGYIVVDTNGDKPPNKDGLDAFLFRLTKYGLIPFGSAGETARPVTGCRRDQPNGENCTAWVIYQENMDYLTCELGADCDSKIHW